MRKPRDELLSALDERTTDIAAAGVLSVQRAGDALAPGAIVHAIHSGHLVGREVGLSERRPYRRDFPLVPLQVGADAGGVEG
jgi:dimethylamine/trimethylamine dehydrogenase